jgi:hypothetical protein
VIVGTKSPPKSSAGAASGWTGVGSSIGAVVAAAAADFVDRRRFGAGGAASTATIDAGAAIWGAAISGATAAALRVRWRFGFASGATASTMGTGVGSTGASVLRLRRFGAATGVATGSGTTAIGAATSAVAAEAALRVRRFGASAGAAICATGASGAVVTGAAVAAALRVRRFGAGSVVDAATGAVGTMAAGVGAATASVLRVRRRFGAASASGAMAGAPIRSGRLSPTVVRTRRAGRSSFSGVTTSGLRSPAVPRVRRVARVRAGARSESLGVSTSCMIGKLPPAHTEKGQRSLTASCPLYLRSCFACLMSYRQRRRKYTVTCPLRARLAHPVPLNDPLLSEKRMKRETTGCPGGYAFYETTMIRSHGPSRTTDHEARGYAPRREGPGHGPEAG